MKKYKEYSTEDFICDDNFIRWVKSPSSEANNAWSQFIKENPDKERAINEAIEFVKCFEEKPLNLPENIWSQLSQQINDRIDTPVSAATVHKILHAGTRKRKYYAAAVVTVALMSLTSWWWFSSSGSPLGPESITVQQEYSMNHLKEHSNPRGKRSQIVLEDGTRVWINADSKLEYPTDLLNGATREVYLQGEAFFDVAHDKSRPFIVHIQGVDIKVLGTSFNVKGYKDDSNIETTLVRGAVSIGGDSTAGQVTLSENQRAVFLKQKKKLLVESNVQTSPYTDWRQGILVFDDEPMNAIIPVLERWYNVNIHAEDAYALDCRFTAKINNKSLEEVLELFKSSDRIGYSIVARDIYLKGNFCYD